LVHVQKYPVRITAAGIALLAEVIIVFLIGVGHVRKNQLLEKKKAKTFSKLLKPQFLVEKLDDDRLAVKDRI
jgi:hypothetical protein